MTGLAPAATPRQRSREAGGQPAGRRRLRLRTHLAGLVLAVLLPSLALGGATAWHLARSYQGASEGRLIDTARALALATDAEIGAVLTAAETLAASPLLDDPNGLAAFEVQARRVAERLDTFVVVSGASPPRQIVNTRFPAGAELPPLVAPPLVAEVIRTGRPTVSDLRVPPALGEPVMAVLAPVLRDGRADKVVVVPFRPAHLLRLLQAQALPGETFSAIMDGSGVIVARSRRHEDIVGTPAPGWVEAVIAGRENGVMIGPSREQFDAMAGFQRLSSAPGWYVIVAEPKAAYRASWTDPLLGLAAGGVLAVVLALALAGWLSRRILRPVGALVRRAEAVAAGGDARAHPPEVLPAPVAEFETLRVAGARAEAALAESEAQLRRVLDNLFAFVGLLTPDGTLLEANEAPLRAAGIGIEDVRGRPFWDCYWWSYDPAVQSGVRDACARAAAGESVRYDVAVRMAGDSRMTIDFQVAPLRDAAGRVTHLVPSAVDVTARNAAEAGREESEAQLRAVLDNVPVAVILAEAPSGQILFGNRGVDRLFRHPLRHSAGPDEYTEWEGYHADGGRVQGREYPLAQVIATGGPAELEVHYACGDGVRRWIRMTGAPVRDAERRLTGALVVCADVDAQRRTAELMARLADEREGEVARLGARLGAWFEHGTDHLFVLQVTEHGLFVFEGLNPVHERATGLRSADLRGKTPAEVFPPETAAALEANYRRCVEAGVPISYEEQPDLPAGRKLWETTLVPVRDPVSGRVEMILGSSRDVTEQRQMHTRLAQAQRIEALGQLAGGIAHDFNNVLQAVQGGASLIEKRPNDPNGVRRVARMVFEAAERGSAVTRRLLAFGRRADLRTEAVDAAPLLADMREIFTHTLGAGVGVRVEAPPGLPPLLADKGQLETVLVNLGTNARDAMGGNGILTLAAGLDVPREDTRLTLAGTLKAGRYIRLSVSDTGTGITPEVLARVTEPFFTTKDQGKGTGLGLAMARGFAEQSGGGLDISTEPGRGTTVSIWLPVASGAVASIPPRAGSAPSMGSGRRATVLLVDDEALVRELTAEGLESAGFSVIPADGGPAALALLDAGEEVDVLVSDLSMPGMDGITVIREAQRRRPGLRAILLTGFAGNAAELAIGGAVSGTFSLLRKPVTAEQLGERVAILLEGASQIGREETSEDDGKRNGRP